MKAMFVILALLGGVASYAKGDLVAQVSHPAIGEMSLYREELGCGIVEGQREQESTMLIFGYELTLGDDYRLAALQRESDGSLSGLLWRKDRAVYLNVRSDPPPGSTFEELSKFVKGELEEEDELRVAPILLNAGRNVVFVDALRAGVLHVREINGKGTGASRVFVPLEGGGGGYLELSSESEFGCEFSIKNTAGGIYDVE